MTIPNFPVTVPYAPWSSFPSQFPTICPYFQAVAKVTGLNLIAHETEKSNVNWGHAKLEGFKMQAEVMAKTEKDLTDIKEKERDYKL